MPSTTFNTSTPIVVTGASGLVGSAIALRFLDLGYSVRLPLRKPEQADLWLKQYGSKYPGKIETVILKKGITEEGAFDEAVKGVEVVVHAASPATFAVTNGEEELLKPAIDGTVSILNSAKNSGTVKSFVYTTSASAFIRFEDLLAAGPAYKVDEDTWNSTTYEEATAMPIERAQDVYAASKALAEKAAWNFVKENNVDFSFSTIAPVVVLGHHLAPGIKTLSDIASSYKLCLDVLLDKTEFPPYDMTGFNPEFLVSISDIARAHADAALNPSISNGHRYIVYGAQKTWPQVVRSMIKAQPELKARLPPVSAEPTEDENPKMGFPVDNTKIKKHFGWEYQPFDELIGDWAKQVYQLAKAGGQL